MVDQSHPVHDVSNSTSPHQNITTLPPPPYDLVTDLQKLHIHHNHPELKLDERAARALARKEKRIIKKLERAERKAVRKTKKRERKAEERRERGWGFW
jgi:hypothetical protein